MASTKQKQQEAKQRRQAEKVSINEHKFTEMLINVSQVILTQNPNHGYNQTDDSLKAAKMIIEHNNLTSKYLPQLQNYVNTVDQGIEMKYGISLSKGVGAFFQDFEEGMKENGVPQNIRVMVGLLDTLTSVMALRGGLIKFQNIDIKDFA